jgi:hypothetical protein
MKTQEIKINKIAEANFSITSGETQLVSFLKTKELAESWKAMIIKANRTSNSIYGSLTLTAPSGGISEADMKELTLIAALIITIAGMSFAGKFDRQEAERASAQYTRWCACLKKPVVSLAGLLIWLRHLLAR